MTTIWHAEDDLLRAYAAGSADDVVASSVEAHLVACGSCRSRLARHVPQDRLFSNWEAVVVALDAPRPGLVEHLLVRVGVSPSTARLLVATPALRWSWAASVAMALTFSLVAATRPGAEAFLLLLTAPLVPLAGVALAFNRSLDPSAEIVDATPLGGCRFCSCAPRRPWRPASSSPGWPVWPWPLSTRRGGCGCSRPWR